jgi:hypothetical protein
VPSIAGKELICFEAIIALVILCTKGCTHWHDEVASAKIADVKTTLNKAVLFHQYAENYENLLPHAEQEIEELCKEVTDCCVEVAETVFKPMAPFVKCLEMCISVSSIFHVSESVTRNLF